VLVLIIQGYRNTPYCSGDENEKKRWAGHVARVGERRDVYRVLVGKREGKRPLERPMCSSEDNMI
jgi:hypothetical protein